MIGQLMCKYEYLILRLPLRPEFKKWTFRGDGVTVNYLA